MERRTALRTVATGVLAGLAIGVGTASAQLPVPDVPDVKVPDVPSVPVPQVPSVPAPAPAPQVQVPQVPQVPDVPRSVPAPAPVPSVSVPRTPVTSGGGGGGGGGSSSAPASSGRSSGGGGGAGGGGSAATGGSGRSAAAARPASTGGDEGDDGDGRAAPQRRSTARRRGQGHARSGAVREERLRETVHQLAGCLDELREAPRRVLVLRSGYGPVTPHSRSQVADRLDIAQPRVKRLERRGLRRLRSLERHGGCGGGDGATSLTETGSSGGDMRLTSTSGVGEDTGGGGSDGGVADAVKDGLSAPASAVKDLFESSPSDGTSSSGESSNPPATVVQQPSGGIGVWSLLAFVAGLGLLGFAIRRELQT